MFLFLYVLLGFHGWHVMKGYINYDLHYMEFIDYFVTKVLKWKTLYV